MAKIYSVMVSPVFGTVPCSLLPVYWLLLYPPYRLSEIVSLRQRNLFLGNDFLFNLSSYKGKQDKALEILHGHTNKVIETRRRELDNANVRIQSDENIGKHIHMTDMTPLVPKAVDTA